MPTIKEVVRRGTQAAEDGNFSNALADYLWAHDNPSPDDPASEYFRRVTCFFCWANLGAVYAPAHDEMLALIAEKEAYLRGNPDDAYVQADLRAMQGALENAKTIHAPPT